MEKTVCRRAILKGAVALGAASMAPWAAARAAAPHDVLIVGTGAGGYAAAIRAAEAGAKVLMLEANTWVGGASRVATGIFGCAGHPIQKALGFTTTPEDLYRLYISTAGATKTKADPAAARILADGAIPAADWLASLGVRWSTKHAMKFFLRVTEGHRLGELLIDSLDSRARSLGVEILTGCRATGLLKEGKRVSGVEADTPAGKRKFESKAVVLACGGFEANPEMIRKYIGEGWDEARFYCTPTDRGDGQRMAEAAGAALSDMEVFKANPTVHESHGNRWNLITAVRAGAIAVGRDGSRLINELGGYWQSRRLWKEPGHRAWLIFGDPVRDAVLRVRQLLQEGTVFEAETLQELASKAGIDPAGLEAGVKRYREMLAAGKDADFGRPIGPNPFGGKYYAAEIQPWIQGTFGGVVTNVKTEALTPQGTVLPGLYVVGECASAGLCGVNPQTANAVFGSIAGRESARYAKSL